MFSVQSISTTLSALMSIVRTKCRSTKRTKLVPTRIDSTPASLPNAQLAHGDKVSAQSLKLNTSKGKGNSRSQCRNVRTCNSTFAALAKLFGQKQLVGNISNSWKVDFNELRDLEFVGSGSQGKVFSGVYRGERIAFKRVASAKATDMRYIRKLCHPNVVRFRGVCVDSPNFGLLMEFCAFGNLHDAIYKRNLLGMPTVLRWAADIASGMNYLHHNGIVHRDLKPQNILVKNRAGSLKIADFDMSRKIGKHASPITFAGTVAYMAPEVLRQVSLTFKVDVWAYGVVLWEILTRRTPYGNFNELAIIYGVGLDTLRLQIPNNCSMSFRKLLTSCLQKAPGRRPSFERILTLLRTAAGETLQPNVVERGADLRKLYARKYSN